MEQSSTSMEESIFLHDLLAPLERGRGAAPGFAAEIDARGIRHILHVIAVHSIGPRLLRKRWRRK